MIDDGSRVIECPDCRGYRLSGTAEALLAKGSVPKPDLETFRNLVGKKRGTSSDYPLITEDDLKKASERRGGRKRP